MALRYSLSEHGRAFATRGRASELRDELLAQAAGDDVVLDFAGVTNVTYSFADELLGKLIAEDAVHVEPVNMVASVALTVRRAVERRAGRIISC
jgi:STAS-like domain of unknown function (DUF4325)